MRLIRLLTTLAVPAVSMLALAAPATAASPVTGPSRPSSVSTLATFEHAAGETPENIVITEHEVVVSLAFASTVAVLDHSGRRQQSLRLDTAGGFIAGLALDHRRRALAIAVSSPDAGVAGIYEAPFTRGRLGLPAQLAALPAGAFPNGLAFDPAGDLYAADSLLGTIWRVPAHARAAAPAQAWLQDPLLRPGAAGLPGANGLKYRKGSLYVSNTGRSTLLAIPLTGRQARTVVVVRDDLRIDDFTLDRDGTLYAALNQANEVVRTPLNPHDGPVYVLATTKEGVHNPSAVAFADRREGSGRCGGSVLYVTEAAFDGPTPPPSVQLIRLDRR